LKLNKRRPMALKTEGKIPRRMKGSMQHALING
jgi:hypothetical protein